MDDNEFKYRVSTFEKTIKQKTHMPLFMPCDIYRLSNIKYNVCSNFTSVSTATESDVASGQSNG